MPSGARPRPTPTARPSVAIAVVSSAAVLGALVMPTAARAGTHVNSLTSSTLVISACIVSGTTLDFGGAISPVGAAPVDATSTLTVQCTANTPYTVSLDAGTNAGGAANFAARAMRSGSRLVSYQLYLNAGRTTVWGNGTGSSVHSGSGTGGTQTLTVYGRLPSLTGAVPGTYTDTVTIIVTY